jgi:RNA polymerase sigma-70 factor (ECF subfamily)
VTDSASLDHYPEVGSLADTQGDRAAAPRVGEPGAMAPGVPSFNAVYEATFELAWRVLRRMGVAAPQLDDAAQDVFVVVHRRLPEFEGRSSLRTWVAGIAVRVAADYRRRFRRQGTQLDLDLTEDLPDPKPDPAESVASAEARALVARLLLALPESQREVFVLVELEGLSAPEVAQAIGVNLNTVYSRLRLARRAFNAELEQHQKGEARCPTS